MPPRGGSRATAKNPPKKSSKKTDGKGAAAAAVPESGMSAVVPDNSDPAQGSAPRSAHDTTPVAADVPPPVTPVRPMPRYNAPPFPAREQRRYDSSGESFAGSPSPPAGAYSDDDLIVNAAAPKAAPKAAPVPIYFSPVKQKRAAQGISRLRDVDVWGMKDEDIIGV